MSRSRRSIERDGRFLVVEERIGGRLVINQPAGHLEDGESLVAAVVRETLEETAWHFTPEALLGLYLWRSPRGHSTLRIAFIGTVDGFEPQRRLDPPVLRTHWLTRSELAARGARSCARRWCCAVSTITWPDGGCRWPRWPSHAERAARADTIAPPCMQSASSSGCPAASTPPSPRCCSSEAGYEVQGLFMSNWDEDDVHCTTAQDYQDARAVAAELGIVLHRVNFAEQYREHVFASFLEEYRAGRTPNPDVLCNREIKFGLCLRLRAAAGRRAALPPDTTRALRDARGRPGAVSGTTITTRISRIFCTRSRARASRACCSRSAICTRSRCASCARRAGLPVHAKPDSTGICFIGERPFAEFLGQYLPATPGPIETLEGKCLGQHRGLPFYTLGQRSGLTLGGARGFAAEPWYVCAQGAGAQRTDRRAAARAVAPALAACADRADQLALRAARAANFDAAVKLRYRQPAQPATVHMRADGGALLEFDARPARRHAGAICRAVRGRALPGRRP